jgi:hypothetical protein
MALIDEINRIILEAILEAKKLGAVCLALAVSVAIGGV